MITISTLYFLQFNNYYNRTVKVYSTLDDYLDYNVYTQQGFNFVPGDNVTTTLPAVPVNQANEDLTADYLLVVDNGAISSRWYIMDSTRLLNSTWKFNLRRDLVADRLGCLDWPCFVTKGIVDDQDPAIFNNEGLSYNQIKVKEQLLKDASGCQWLVGYYARKTGETTTNLEGDSVDYSTNITYTVNSIANWPYYTYTTNDFIGVPSSIKYNVRVNKLPQGSISTFYFTDLDNGTIGHYLGNPCTGPAQYTYNSDSAVDAAVTAIKESYGTIRNAAKTQANFHEASEVSSLLSQTGAIIFDSAANKYYQVTAINSYPATTTNYAVGTTGTLYETLNGCFTSSGFTTITGTAQFNYSVYGAPRYRIELTEIKLEGTYKYDIPAVRRFTYDAPYDVFAIPYGNFTFNGVNCSTTAAMSAAMGIATKYGTTHLYDLQLLPYCPFEISGNTYTSTDTKEYSYITTTGSNPTNVGVIFNVSSVSRQSFTVDCPIAVTNTKIANETQFCRLVSPDYSSSFEFSPAKNRGVDYIKVDMTVKPFQPYIHLAPNFKGLYGADFDDARGLICGGSFSLSIVTDQWKTYQLNNANYERIFNRQIQNLDINNRYQRISEGLSAFTGALSAGAQASAIGGPAVGISVGAISMAAGAGDMVVNEKLRQEAKAYTTDLYNLQLGNIRALPNTLTRVDSFNQQNKKWPFIEFYDCTDSEKIALANTIKFGGMTVNRTGTLRDYSGSIWQANVNGTPVVAYFPFVAGKLLWTLSSPDYYGDASTRFDDYHYIQNLAAEVAQGFYLVTLPEEDN